MSQEVMVQSRSGRMPSLQAWSPMGSVRGQWINGSQSFYVILSSIVLGYRELPEVCVNFLCHSFVQTSCTALLCSSLINSKYESEANSILVSPPPFAFIQGSVPSPANSFLSPEAGPLIFHLPFFCLFGTFL